MLKFFTINTIAEIICFLIAITCLSKDKMAAWRIRILFLLITCIAELTGIYVKHLYLSDRVHIHPNAWVYNILIFFQIAFFNFIFQQTLKKFIQVTPFIIVISSLLIILHVYEICSQSVYIYDDLANSALSILIVLYSLYYFFHLIKDEKPINIGLSADFWWVAGTLLFYFGTTAYNVFYEQLSSIVTKTGQNPGVLKYLHNVFNIILYGCWSYSFICRRWETKKSES